MLPLHVCVCWLYLLMPKILIHLLAIEGRPTRLQFLRHRSLQFLIFHVCDPIQPMLVLSSTSQYSQLTDQIHASVLYVFASAFCTCFVCLCRHSLYSLCFYPSYFILVFHLHVLQLLIDLSYLHINLPIYSQTCPSIYQPYWIMIKHDSIDLLLPFVVMSHYEE